MKNYIQKLYLLPLLGFLTAGCSTSSNLQSSEVDDVYFSSKDKVTYVAPEYALNTEGGQASESSYSEDIEDRVSDPETYANSGRRSNNTPYQYSYYDAPFGNPFYAYHDPFYYPGRYYSRAAMMNPWIDPWYDPFWGPSMGMMYDPFWPRYGSGVSVAIGIGWGRAYNPWGWGYGGGFGYNPYRYGGYYGGFYDNYTVRPIAAHRVTYGPRNDRSSNVAGRNPNISRVGRNSVVAPEAERTSRSGRTRSGEVVSRPRSSSAEAYPERNTQPARTRRGDSQTMPTQTRTREVVIPTPSRSSGGSSTPPPSRRRRDEPSASSSRSETRTYTPPRSSYEPSRSSYEPSRSSSYEPSRSSSGSSGSSGSSSSSGRRGRN